jgi:hypothetical protein
MYTPKDHDNKVATHAEGAIELRATFLSHQAVKDEDGDATEEIRPHALSILVLDIGSVSAALKAIKGQEKIAGAVDILFELVNYAAAESEDGHKIEITAETINKFFEVYEAPKPPKTPTPIAAGKKKAVKKKTAAASLKEKLKAQQLPLPETGGPKPPDLPNGA